MNYYEHHLGDYAKDTAHLTMLEHGAYRLLLDRYYGTEQGIPSDQAHRVARARTREEKVAVDAILAEFFTLEDGIWKNGRAEEEIAKAALRIKAAKENGKRGGRPKKVPGSDSETQEKPSGFSVGSDSETQEKAYQAPSTKHQTPEGIQAAAVDQPPIAAADPIHSRAIELAVLLRHRGAALQASDPRVRRWAEAGISDTQALAALETAQQRRTEQGNAQPINAGYLDAILRDIPVGNTTGRASRNKRIDSYAAEAAAARGDHDHEKNRHGDGAVVIEGECSRTA